MGKQNKKNAKGQILHRAYRKNRDEIICLLRSIGREGIDTVIEHLDANNYFTYAASKARHDSFYGGLAIIR